MQPYTPEALSIRNLDKVALFTTVGEANVALARYDSLLMGMVNPAVMLSPLISQEAVLSSKIEGTQATVEDVFEHEAGGNTTRKRIGIFRKFCMIAAH